MTVDMGIAIASILGCLFWYWIYKDRPEDTFYD